MTEVHREAPGTLLGDCCTDLPARDRVNQMYVLRAVVAWTVAFAGTTLLVTHGLISRSFAWFLAVLPIALGFYVVRAYSRYLREADELQRTIHLNALGIGFGGTWLVVTAYQVLEQLGAPEAGSSEIVLVMALLYVASVLIGRRRYR